MGGLASSLVAVSMSVFAWLAWGEVLSAKLASDVTTVGVANLEPLAAGAVPVGAPRLTPDNAVIAGAVVFKGVGLAQDGLDPELRLPEMSRRDRT